MKYIKVSGSNPDYRYVTYEITTSSLQQLLEELQETVSYGGEIGHVKLEVVEMKPSEYKKLAEV